jgi:hypothetical protein
MTSPSSTAVNSEQIGERAIVPTAKGTKLNVFALTVLMSFPCAKYPSMTAILRKQVRE